MFSSTQDVNVGWDGEHDGVMHVTIWCLCLESYQLRISLLQTLYQYIGDVTLVK
jgi:hypothetical protein